MEIKIEGDPGTGNTFVEINIQHVENFHASAFNNKRYARETAGRRLWHARHCES